MTKSASDIKPREWYAEPVPGMTAQWRVVVLDEAGGSVRLIGAYLAVNNAILLAAAPLLLLACKAALAHVDGAGEDNWWHMDGVDPNTWPPAMDLMLRKAIAAAHPEGVAAP